jgi:phosphopantothenoylcysteine decarboxylase/phosphopantothenate--cysteine ligase
MDMIALGVSSSISIYKACEILRGFQKEGIDVHVLMTRNAAKFISPYLFSSLSGHRAIVDPFEEEYSGDIDHIALAREAALFLVAPATANVIAKFASGVADDFLSTFFLAARSSVLIAPAMNEAMFLHPQTQENIRRLKARGVEFVEPERGYQACGDEGWGRLAPVDEILREGLRLIRRTRNLQGKTVLITAGPTREFLDPVRFLSNPSTGRMGYELAAEARRRGARVVLVSGPSPLTPPACDEFVRVTNAREMKAAVEGRFAAADIVIMAAAVSDFRFRATAARKAKKNEVPGRLELVLTDDILSGLARRRDRPKKIVVGFAAETGNAVEKAGKKLRAKRLDLIVANDVSEAGIGFESEFNRVVMVGAGGEALATEKKSKREISRDILDRVEVLLEKKA